MYRYVTDYFKNIAITLRFSILSIFTTLFIVAIVLIVLINSIRFKETVTYTSDQLMLYESNAVMRELLSVITPSKREANFTASLIHDKVLHDDETQLVPYTFYLAKNFPLIAGSFWTDEHGDYVYSVKQPDNTIATELFIRSKIPNEHRSILYDLNGVVLKNTIKYKVDYDPRTEVWYQAAKQTEQSIWTNIYAFKLHPDRGITTASPVIIEGRFEGIFGINISLDFLSDYMTNRKVTKNGYSFIVTTDENLIAFPNRPPFTQIINPNDEIINVHNIKLPVVDESLDYYRATQKERFTFKYQDKEYLISYMPIKEFSHYGWLVGVVIPIEDFLGPLQETNRLTLLISIIIFLLSIIIVSMLVTRIINPIRLLVHETEKIKNFDLMQDINIKSRIKEVVYLRNAIRAMKIGLRSFQKYVPKTLVRQLIESGEDTRIGGVKRLIAILFTDIENFTTIAEITPPNQLMSQLGEYLEALSQILIQEKGTIDKYIGDSIMAFWGAPLPELNPCIYAADAALKCQSKVNELNKQWLKDGKHPFITRIGIHTGEAIVGNIGSSERLNYTALGDTINMGSRLEKVNKSYHTHIIVSQEVYDLIKDHFVLRMIDCVAVKGKFKSNCLYELIAKTMAEVSFDINQYRKYFDEAFRHYQKREWDKAIEHFEQCIRIYTDDTIAPIFIHRCNHFKLRPPPDDWHGVTKLKI